MNRRLVLAMTLLVVLMGILSVAFGVQRVEAQFPTIYISADGSVYPSTANITSLDNVTYTFTGNINESIAIERTNIIIDGNGYTLNGSAGDLYAGFIVNNIDPQADDNVTIQNVNVMGFLVGFWFTDTEGNQIFGCNITDNIDGIWFVGVWNSTVSGNNIANNSEGIELQSFSSNNTISENNIANNWGVGILHRSGSNNKFYYNYLINNNNQAGVDVQYANIWDDGAGKGNYWSDYEEKYPNATEIDGSGIWGTPYVINENNQDTYPIVPEFPSFLTLPLFMVTTLLAVIVYRRKHSM